MCDLSRCVWCGDDPLYRDYHDNEWGQPCRDEKSLFEFLILEGAQAGLSWISILKRREGYRRAFADFDVAAVANFTEADVDRLVLDSGIIRNRLKIKSAVNNARQFQKIQCEFGSFSDFIWAYVDNQPVINHCVEHKQIPATTELSDRISKDMKNYGFTFFGSTICYAYLQAMGLVNDHVVSCFTRNKS
jgi:DNA-3-methyladenine glycosylase I